MFKFFVISNLFSILCFANISPVRQSGQSYQELMTAYSTTSALSSDSKPENKSAMQASSPFESLDSIWIPKWESYEVMLERFEEIRDERFMRLEDEFPRRISWMFPDDGCYSRAAMFIKKAKEKKYKAPRRVYIFGDLVAKTDNNIYGEVSWWYHTAPVVRVDEQVYVLDPAIEPNYPLTIENWILKQSNQISDVLLSYCKSDTYGPGNSCLNPRRGASFTAEMDQDYFLDLEWYRQLILERDPLDVLGEKAPWLIN